MKILDHNCEECDEEIDEEEFLENDGLCDDCLVKYYRDNIT